MVLQDKFGVRVMEKYLFIKPQKIEVHVSLKRTPILCVLII